jgi:hypothetical protein
MGPFWKVSVQGAGRDRGGVSSRAVALSEGGLRGSGIYAGYSEGGWAGSEGPAASMAPGRLRVERPRFPRVPIITASKGPLSPSR